MTAWRVREAVAEDVPDIVQMIKDLAMYLKEPESAFKNTEKVLQRDGFGENPWFRCLMAEELKFSENNHSLPKRRAVGYAVFHNIYSTWKGRALFMVDLYVEPASRGKGIGTAILKKIAEIAVERGCSRVDWHIQQWNKVAADFYHKQGAVCLDEWQVYHLTGEHLLEFAGRQPLLDRKPCLPTCMGSSDMTSWRVREAVAEDVPDILQMIKDLAVYEKEPDSVVKNTEKAMLKDAFGENPWFECLIAEEHQFPEKNNSLPKRRAVGYALFFNSYSTWKGRSLYMEDLYVEPACRGKGIATEMLKKISEVAVEKGCSRVDWQVLQWNNLAADFYLNRGAVCLDQWRLYRLAGEALLEFTGKKPS